MSIMSLYEFIQTKSIKASSDLKINIRRYILGGFDETSTYKQWIEEIKKHNYYGCSINQIKKINTEYKKFLKTPIKENMYKCIICTNKINEFRSLCDNCLKILKNEDKTTPNGKCIFCGKTLDDHTCTKTTCYNCAVSLNRAGYYGKSYADAWADAQSNRSRRLGHCLRID